MHTRIKTWRERVSEREKRAEYGYVPFSAKLKKRKYVKWKEHLHRMDTRGIPEKVPT